jgi:hypothetical protein
LTSQGHYHQAEKVAIAGWAICVEKLSPSGQALEVISWENIDPSIKEELLKYSKLTSLRLSQLAVEMKLNGAEKMIDPLQKTFILFRRLIGTVSSIDDSSRKDDGAIKLMRSASNTPSMPCISSLTSSINSFPDPKKSFFRIYSGCS